MGFIEELEGSIDIVELIGKYTRLKKTGANYKALCPFPGHSEKTPSFVVSPAKQIGYCFGCHKGGGPVKFIMDMENCEFREAVEILGQVTGREIQGFTENKEKIQIKKNLYSLFKDATNYYKTALGKNPEVQKYLAERGMNEDSIKKFHLGYADSGVGLYNYLKEKGYTDELIRESNVFLDIPQRKDKFIGRIIYPIQNLRGDFVAFAGRIIGQGEPKYLNSPASPFYDKSAILYGLYDGRSSITKENFIIITEGYMDTIALHEGGFTNTVAVSGTALTEKHITMIKRLTHKLYLCFDNDKAGEQATKSSLELLKNKDIEVRIILLEGGKDPDEILKKGKDFKELISKAVSPVAFYIKKSDVDLSSLDEKKKFLTEILQVVQSYGDNVEKDMYLKEIGKLLDIHTGIIYDEMKKLGKGQKQVPEKVPQKEQNSSEDILISFLLEYPDFKQEATEKLLFEEGEGEIWKKYIQKGDMFLGELPLEKRESLKALTLAFTEEEELEILKNLIVKVNRERYKKSASILKEEVNAGKPDADKRYIEIIGLGKKLGFK